MATNWRWIIGLIAWMSLYSHAPAQDQDLQVPGLLDLRGHNWSAEPQVIMDDCWIWSPRDSSASHISPVTDLWKQHFPHPTWSGTERGTYQCLVMLDSNRTIPMGLALEEVLSAYEIRANGQLLGGNGSLSQGDHAGTAAIAPQCYPLPSDGHAILLEIRCTNAHLRRGGITKAPVIGSMTSLWAARTSRAILGGILIGLLIMGSAYQAMRFGYRRREIAFLVNSLWALAAGLHFTFLHERWTYQLLGDQNWALCYRLELVTLFLTFLMSLVFLKVFFNATKRTWILWAIGASQATLALIAMTAPIKIAAMVDVAIPYTSLSIIFAWTYFLIDAARRKHDGVLEIGIATAAILMSTLLSSVIWVGHVGSLLPVHYFFSGYILMFAWILSRRSAAIDRQVVTLGEDLAASNRALESHNERLEAEVQSRTAELTRVQQQTHEMEMEHLRSSLEALSSNNQLKLQLHKNLMEELQTVLTTGSDYPTSLRSMIASLRGQVATEERIAVLQTDFDAVNADFYRRLQAKCPQLSKTERELCAYIKLNLSGKDIATLRKTSSNTINVTRHRIRKKLNLERDEELEALIQAI